MSNASAGLPHERVRSTDLAFLVTPNLCDLLPVLMNVSVKRCAGLGKRLAVIRGAVINHTTGEQPADRADRTADGKWGEDSRRVCPERNRAQLLVRVARLVDQQVDPRVA